MTPVVLVVQHQELCPPGWVGEWLTAEGLRLDVRHPYAGDPLPDDLGQHDGLVVLGGQMGANDDDAYPWLTPTKDLIRSGAAHEVPVLGICLGHQLAAAALGGEVVVNPAGARRGVLEMSWSGAGADPVVGSCGGTCRVLAPRRRHPAAGGHPGPGPRADAASSPPPASRRRCGVSSAIPRRGPTS